MSSFNETQRSSMASHDRMVRYREIYDNLSTSINENGYNDNMSNIMNNTIQEVQSLHEEGGMEDRIRHPGELYLDSRVLKAASDIAVRATESVSGNVNIYDKLELAQHIRENPNFWVFMLPHEFPSFAFLYGTFDPTPLERRPRAPRRAVQRQQAHALRAPDKVDKLQKVDEGSDMMSRVNRFIKKTYKQTGEPLSYFHTVLDPTSFSATIENIYYVSFLVKDTLISLYLDDTFGLPFITPVAATGETRDIAEENQFIVSIDEQRWQDLVNAFGITRPMMVLKR